MAGLIFSAVLKPCQIKKIVDILNFELSVICDSKYPIECF